MDKIVLSVKLRDLKNKPKSLREKGLVPAQLYGAKKDNMNLQIDKNDFVRIYRKAGGNTILELDVEEVGVENVLVYDVAYDPVTDEVQHIDLIRVRMDEKVTASIPLEFVGFSKAVKDLGGILNTNMDEVEVTCLPADLPKSIEVKIDALQTFDDVINISNLIIPIGVEIQHEDTQVVASVLEPRSDDELAALNEEVSENVEGVEVEEKGKTEEGGEEGEKSEKSEEKKDDSKNSK